MNKSDLEVTAIKVNFMDLDISPGTSPLKTPSSTDLANPKSGLLIFVYVVHEYHKYSLSNMFSQFSKKCIH